MDGLRLSRMSAAFVTFLLSALCHELVMAVVSKKLRPYLFLMQVCPQLLEVGVRNATDYCVDGSAAPHCSWQTTCGPKKQADWQCRILARSDGWFPITVSFFFGHYTGSTGS